MPSQDRSTAGLDRPHGLALVRCQDIPSTIVGTMHPENIGKIILRLPKGLAAARAVPSHRLLSKHLAFLGSQKIQRAFRLLKDPGADLYIELGRADRLVTEQDLDHPCVGPRL